MKDQDQPNHLNLIWGAMLALMGLASTDILESWFHDPRARFSVLGFLFWAVGCGFRWRPLRTPWTRSTIGLAACSGVSAALGILGELNALIYFGFAGWYLCPVASPGSRILGALAAPLWMPVFPWLVSERLGAATPWVSLIGLGTVGAAIAIFPLSKSYESKTNHLAS